MNVGNSVRKAIDDWQVDQIEAAMLHACAAVDGTAKKANPSESSSKRRFTRFLRNNYHILGPMGASGLEIQNQRFPVRLDSPSTTPDGLPDFADVIYVVHRNPQAHGDELLPGFELMPDAAYLPGHTSVLIEPGKVRLSDRVIFGLIAVAVMSPVNHDQRVPDGYYLTYGSRSRKLMINDWWGRAKDFPDVVAEEPPPGPVLMDFGDWMDNVG